MCRVTSDNLQRGHLMKINIYELFVKDKKCPRCNKGNLIWMGESYKYKCDYCYEWTQFNVTPSMSIEER